jgi:hypothetical protein
VGEGGLPWHPPAVGDGAGTAELPQGSDLRPAATLEPAGGLRVCGRMDGESHHVSRTPSFDSMSLKSMARYRGPSANLSRHTRGLGLPRAARAAAPAATPPQARGRCSAAIDSPDGRREPRSGCFCVHTERRTCALLVKGSRCWVVYRHGVSPWTSSWTTTRARRWGRRCAFAVSRVSRYDAASHTGAHPMRWRVYHDAVPSP